VIARTFTRLVTITLIMIYLTGLFLAQEVSYDEVCGSQVTPNVDSTFWAIAGDNLSLVTIEDQRVSVNPLVPLVRLGDNIVPSDVMIIDDGRSIALLTAPSGSRRRDDPLALHVVTRTGETISADDLLSETQRWWRFIPGSSSNILNIFGYTTDQRAFIAEVSYSEDNLLLEQLNYLPFEFSPMMSNWQTLSISPDGKFLALGQPLDASMYELVVYSIAGAERVWQIPYAWDNFVNVVWTGQDEWIALISGLTNHMGEVSRVNSNGTSEALMDLNAVFNTSDARIVTGNPVDEYSIALWISGISDDSYPEEANDQLLIYQSDTGEIINTCFVASAAPVIGQEEGGYLIFRQTNQAEPSRLIIFWPEEGNFSYIETNVPIIPLGEQLIEL